MSFYFEDKKTCLFIIDENTNNEKTIPKDYLKNLYLKFETLGITLILLYSTYFDNKYDIVISRLLYRLSDAAMKIDARKCEVKEVSYKDGKDFLNKYHFQGNVMSKFRVGLYYKDELVSLIVLCKPRYNKEYDYEVGRYAIKFNYNVRGNFSKMISFFIKKYSPKSILTYHDILFGNNITYEKCGFRG